MEIIYGKSVVMEALKANHKILKIYLLSNSHNEEIVKLANNKKVPLVYLDKQGLDKIVSGLHQGVIAEAEDYRYESLDNVLSKVDKDYPLFVMLDSLEDPHNLGAILRTCDAANVDGIILSKNRSVRLNSTVAKVSTGAIEHVKVIEVTNLTQTLVKMKKLGYWVVTAEKTEKSIIYNKIDYKMPIVLVIGSEGKGVSRLVLEQSDFVVQIPMGGHVNSLNASVSAAILIYKILENRQKEN